MAVTDDPVILLVLAHVQELLEQNANKVRRLCPNVKVGIYSAGLKQRDTESPIICAGIQSVYRRACELDAFDLVIVDEAHLIPPDGDGMYRQFLSDALVINPHLRVIGMTATPYRLKSGLICSPDHFLNHVCYDIGIRELIRDGYLCPLVSKAGQSKAHTENVTVRGGEFVAGELESLMNRDSPYAASAANLMTASLTTNSATCPKPLVLSTTTPTAAKRRFPFELTHLTSRTLANTPVHRYASLPPVLPRGQLFRHFAVVAARRGSVRTLCPPRVVRQPDARNPYHKSTLPALPRAPRPTRRRHPFPAPRVR